MTILMLVLAICISKVSSQFSLKCEPLKDIKNPNFTKELYANATNILITRDLTFRESNFEHQVFYKYYEIFNKTANSSECSRLGSFCLRTTIRRLKPAVLPLFWSFSRHYFLKINSMYAATKIYRDFEFISPEALNDAECNNLWQKYNQTAANKSFFIDTGSFAYIFVKSVLHYRHMSYVSLHTVLKEI